MIINFSQKNINTIINKYIQGESTIKIANIFNVNNKTITKILKNNNIPIRSSSDCHKKFSNENIFQTVDCHQKAYWLGFLAADGNVSKHGQLSLQLAAKDLDHLKKFYQFMGGKSKITKIITHLDKNKYIGYRVSFKSNKLIQDLAKYNILPAKSKTLTLPNNIPIQYLPSFILGLVDGDGSFFKSNNKLNFSLISSIDCCNQVKQILIEHAKVNNIKLYPSSPGMAYLTYCGNNNIYKIAKFLYSNQPEIYLKRKKQIVVDTLPNKYPRDF